MEFPIILLAAVAIDLIIGEPPNYLHPVVWMGKTISFLERFDKGKSNAIQFTWGIAMVVFTLALFITPVYLALFYLKEYSFIGYLVLGTLLLKPTFSLKGLQKAALVIKTLLQENKLDKVRYELRSLVSRDTGDLSEPQLVSATVESISENSCDSFVAPLFYFMLFGIPGAIGYRVVNTFDAMIGYRGEYEYLGKFASKLDDILNYIPARITALFTVIAAFLSGRNGRLSWQTAMAEHTKTESPNAGWPMAAMAGALNVQLEKMGYYKLGEGTNTPTVETIDSSLKLLWTSMFIWLLICLIAGGIYFVVTT